jgi:predicted SAM-dependent methyltransferase
MKSKVDQEHKNKFEKVWDKGDYRQGSTAQRMYKRILDIIPMDATINDYGCGTGRAEVELLQTRPVQIITMIDIAENALEAPARELIDNPKTNLSFIMSDLSDLSAVPHADWGMCINVLMTVQKDKLDIILKEIRRTCDNLIFEAYDFEDKRCGWQMTTVKLDKIQWQAKLREFWPEVKFEPSPESNRRYIFVCQSKAEDRRPKEENQGQKAKDQRLKEKNNVIPAQAGIQKLQNKYAGQTCYIIGRGPSLLNIKKENIGAGPVIVINEAIYNIAALKLDNDIYSQWRNGDMPDELPQYLKAGDTLLLCENNVPQYENKVDKYKDYSPLYFFECRRDLSHNPEVMFSHAAAVEIAVRIFGCTKLVMMGFDSYLNDDRTVLKHGFVKSEFRPGDYREQINIIESRLAEMPMIKAQWYFPPVIKEPIKLNIGCGDVPIKGYVNIDLHVEAADVKMNALELEYADGEVDEIYSSHLLEHFGKNDVPKALKEWYRVLKNGGKLSMNLPNLEWCLKNWLNQPEDKKWGLPLDMIYGLQTNDGEYHKTGFTRSRLEQLLKAAGFKNISITDHQSHAQSCFKVECVKNLSVTVITLTGDRPDAFALCRRWMENQTVPPDQWIVIDDGKDPLSVIPAQAGIQNVDYIRRVPLPTDPKHTMIINMKEAVKHVTGDVILIMEDDEYYAPKYIETMLSKLEKFGVVGIGRSKYYHLPSGKYLKDCNMDNASLAQVGFRKSFLPEFTELLAGDQYVDMRIWKHVGDTKTLRWNDTDRSPDRKINGRGYIFDDGENHLYVGMKGLPGRAGICWGHKGEHTHYKLQDTPDRKILKSWVGDDAGYYLQVIET